MLGRDTLNVRAFEQERAVGTSRRGQEGRKDAGCHKSVNGSRGLTEDASGFSAADEVWLLHSGTMPQ